MDKNPMDMSDDEVLKRYKELAPQTVTSYNIYSQEMQRRWQDRHAKQMKILTIAAVVLAAVTTIAAVVPYLPCPC